MATLRQERAALQRAIREVPPDALPALRRIVEAFADALIQHRGSDHAGLEEELAQEMAAWDAASDEALADFERQLSTSS